MRSAEATVRTLAEEWTRDLDAVAGRVFAELRAAIPLLEDDEELRMLTLASCISNVESLLTMLRLGIPASAVEAPVGGIEHAKAMSQRGHEVDATLHFYRVGVASLLREWNAALAERIDEKQELLAALQQSIAFSLEYIDVVSSKVSAAHLAERERLQRAVSLLRADTVERILSGRRVDAAAAERTLGHSLAGRQLGFVCWTEGDPEHLEAGLAAVARLAETRPLTIQEGPRAVLGWLVPGRSAERDWRALERELADAAPAVLTAVGEIAYGIEGFRESHRQAVAARAVAQLATAAPPALLRYRDWALLSLLTRDPDEARAFVARELSELGTRDRSAADLRRTLLEVVRPRGGPAVAARVLGVHRNTVIQRIRRAEALRGAALDVRPAELYTALLLDSWLSPAAQ